MLGNYYPLNKGLLLLLLLLLFPPQSMCCWSGLWICELRLCVGLIPVMVPGTAEVCNQWISLEFEQGSVATRKYRAIFCSISWVNGSSIICVPDTSDGTDIFGQLWVSDNCYSIPVMKEPCLPVLVKLTTVVPPFIWIPFGTVVGGRMHTALTSLTNVHKKNSHMFI